MDQRLHHHIPKNSPLSPQLGRGKVCKPGFIKWLIVSLTINISVSHSPNSQNPAGTFCGGWALVVLTEQLLLCTVFYCRQSPSVILTVFEAIVIFMSLTTYLELSTLLKRKHLFLFSCKMCSFKCLILYPLGNLCM